jgi:hypothetical protein
MSDIDKAPVVGWAEYTRLSEKYGNSQAEEIATEPLILSDGCLLLRSRPGRCFVRDASGNVAGVLNRNQA